MRGEHVMRNKEKGAASIEATISLTIFVFVIMAIYMLINYCLVQAKVSYAINTTAKEMSQYSYFYHVFGLDDLDDKLANGKTQAVDTFNSFNQLLSDSTAEIKEIEENPTDYFSSVLDGEKTEDLTEVYKQIQDVSANVSDVVNDPAEFIKSMASLAGEEAWEHVKSNVIAAPLAKGMTRRHFGNSTKSADAYLKNLGVVDGFEGLNFNMTTMFEDGSDDIKIVVYYNVNLATGLPFDLNVSICQQASTRAWLGGDMK